MLQRRAARLWEHVTAVLEVGAGATGGGAGVVMQVQVLLACGC